jgi:hypothetical protein
MKKYMSETKNVLLKRVAYGFLAGALLLVNYPSVASAAQITARKVTIGTSVASANTTYSLNFTVPSATVIQSASFTACTTASGTCTTPAGFSVASSTLTAQPTNLGDASGWTVNTATAGSLRLVKSGDVAAPTGAQTVGFSSVVNPSATNSTFFLRMTTYSDAAWTTAIDTGTVATSTAGQITVTASVDETLTFTLATATVALGTLSTAATGTGTSAMTVSTNATTGYSLGYTGTTLTSGASTITGLAAPTASAFNGKQFGINLMSNTTPAIGTATSGAGSGLPATGYNTSNLFKFNSGDTIASATVPTNSNTFTASYIANIDGVTAAGAYATALTYTATANF